ncbi:hypothetical protein K501DRAFT_330211 [Backusella circina FSU 941]|nr:hypothetical protein K501DRAFT_330211 [Backusella circina FSU 941]
MTKDSQPKAINIVRPGTFMGTKRMGGSVHSGSVHSGSVHSGSVVSTSSTASGRKPRVTNKVESNNNKPTINLYHPPSRKPSEDGRSMTGRTLYNSNNKPNSIPTSNQQPYYLQQQQQQQQQPPHYYNQQQQAQLQPQRMTKSFTAPSLQTPHEPPRSASPSTNIIRPHRSVLGPITATSNNVHADSEQTSYSSSSEEEEEEDEEEEEEEEEEISDDDDSDAQETTDDENEPRNKARVNRQIEDLEISNQSLLTVNAMLESTVRKQASELAQFKKRMASGELPQQDLIIPVPPPMTAADQEDDSDDWEKDETFQRLRKVTEMMIKQGQKAIDFEYKILGRVLADYQQDEEEEEEKEDDN